MFCGAALTFPGSGDGLLVVAMFRMVIALVAGVGRVSCAQVQFAPASDRLPASVGSPALSKTYRKTENVKIIHENIPENVKS